MTRNPVMGQRPHRVNIDGKSQTIIGKSAVAVLPGQFLKLASGALVLAAADAVKPLYIAGCDDKVGGSILDPIAIGDSITADYVDETRIFAALVKPGVAVVEGETLLAIGAGGQLEIATGAADAIAIAFETYTVPATPVTGGHVKVRML
ncbi:capsid stabilizing protein [Pseudomonas phage DDSR119]|nr:capsid stabilizing protein [Pseudomonas phage DDSR119]